MRRVFLSFPEVTTVVSQLGRPDDGTETTGFFNVEFSVDLKPKSRMARRDSTSPSWSSGWTPGCTREFPGVNFGYSQNIEDNIDEALSGVKGIQLGQGVRPRPRRRRAIANQVVEVMGKVRGNRRSRGLSLARPAQSGDHTRPRGLRALRTERLRRRRGGAGGDRRPGRDAGFRGRSRASTWSCDGSRSTGRASTRSGASASPRPPAPTFRWPRSPMSAPRRARRSSTAKVSSATCRCALPCADATCRPRSTSAKADGRARGQSCPKECTWNGPANTASCRTPTAA